MPASNAVDSCQTSPLSLLAEILPPELAIAPTCVPSPLSTDLLQVAGSGLSMGQLTHWLALENYLYDCEQTLPQAQGWPDVKSLVEACHHCHALELWDLAYRLGQWPIGFAQIPFCEQLARWGQHRSQIELYQNLLTKIDPDVDLLCLDNLGHAHRRLGDLKEAKTYHETQLALARERGDRRAEMNAHKGLGDALYDQFNNPAARVQFQQQYALAIELGDRSAQAQALCWIGDSYYFSQNPLKGVKFLRKAHKIAEALQDHLLEGEILSGLGGLYFSAADHENARICLKAVMTGITTGKYALPDPAFEVKALGRLGITYYYAHQTEEGYRLLARSLQKCRELNLVAAELSHLNNLAVLLSRYKADHHTALGYCQQAFELALRIGSFNVATLCCAHLAVLYALQTEFPTSSEFLRKSRQFYRSHNRHFSAQDNSVFFAYSAHALWLQRKRLRGLFFLARSLIASPPWRTANGRLIMKQAVMTLTPPFLRSFLKWLRGRLLGK